MKNYSKTIIGAIAGDIIGSCYEFHNVNDYNFNIFNSSSHFTDDTVLTIAVADAILHQKDFAKTIWEYGNEYPGRGYGGRFRDWLDETSLKPYNSFGNGSAMRVSPVGFAFETVDRTLEIAKKTAQVTHNHIEGIKGAQAVASAIFLARNSYSKQGIKEFIVSSFDYNLNFTIDEIRPNYSFDETCQGSVPQAIVSFLESSNYESAIRKAIFLGGDSDTIACIAGVIATAFYKEIPQEIVEFAFSKLPEKFIKVIEKFDKTFGESN